MCMRYSHISSLKHLVQANVFAVVVAAASAAAGPGAAAEDASAPPAFIHQALPGATLWGQGQGQMRFLGLRIYGARLWAGPRFEAADFGAHPLALELTYHRPFTDAAIAQRSIEEIERQGELTPAQAQRWQKALAKGAGRRAARRAVGRAPHGSVPARARHAPVARPAAAGHHP